MKQIYTLLVAAAVATTSASALNLNLKIENKELRANSLELVKKESKVAPSATMAKKDIKTSVLSAKKADAEVSIEGDWTFLLGDYYFQNSIGQFEADFTCTLSDGYAIFEDPTGYELPFIAEYDEASGLLFFDEFPMGTVNATDGNKYYLFQRPFVWNEAIGDLDYQPIEGVYDAGTATITFDPENGIAWTADLDEFGAQTAGYFGIYDLEGAARPTAKPDDSADWYNLGNAQIMDGWVVPCFGLDQSEWVFEAPLQQNKKNANLFRVVDPYHNEIFEGLNESTKAGYIVFDVTDPDHVLFEKSEAGWALSEVGVSKFYCYNNLGMYVQYFGVDAATIVDVIGDDIPYTTFKDGVVFLGAIDHPEYGVVYDANFGYQGDPTGGYTWTSGSGEVDMTASITFPEDWAGVKNIATDNVANGAVEFFNLQGVRVANPQAGQLVIKRQGGEVSKMIVR